jgi:hypothetical protein
MLAYKFLARDKEFPLWSYALYREKESKYCLRYKENMITSATEGSFGIFCFQSIEDTLCYPYIGYCRTRIHPIILSLTNKAEMCLYEVEGIGDLFTPDIIALYLHDIDIEEFYTKYNSSSVKMEDNRSIRPTKGTICFPKVRVGKDITEEYLKIVEDYKESTGISSPNLAKEFAIYCI